MIILVILTVIVITFFKKSPSAFICNYKPNNTSEHLSYVLLKDQSGLKE